ncbi:MAG: hypothetical protein CMJ39_13220 [Phycisphaerae bacterium]|nr:hypothetical protein [Phycisphaerae bacterium]
MTTRSHAMAILAFLMLLTLGFRAAAQDVQQPEAAAVSTILESPFKVDPAAMISAAGVLRPEATPLKIDYQLLRSMESRKAGLGVLLEKVPLSAGLTVDLDIKQVEVATDDAQVILMERGPDGKIRERQVEVKLDTIWAGRVVGEPDSIVFLSMSDSGCRGYVRSLDGLHIFSSTDEAQGPVAVYRVGNQIGDIKIDMSGFECHIEDLRGQPFGPQIVEEPLPPFQAPFVSQLNTLAETDSLSRLSGKGFPGGTGEARSDAGDDRGGTPPQDMYFGACCFGPVGNGDDLGVCQDGITLWDCENAAGIYLGHNTSCAQGDETCSNAPLDCFRVRVAIDTDVEFLEEFRGDVDKAVNYIYRLVGASSQIYDRDLSLRLRVPWIRLWSSDTNTIGDTGDFWEAWDAGEEPWDQNNTSTQLNQFRQYWQSTIAPSVSRDLMHMLSGRHLGGGIAYLSAVCTSTGYAVSAGVAQNGFESSNLFPYPIVNSGHSNNWDLIVFTHELGHNLGTGHTHSYFYNSNGTYIDTCAYNCIEPLNYDPSIMSYCHLCDGGLANVHLKFHPFTKGRMYNHLRTLGCAWQQAQEGLLAVEDQAAAIPGLPVAIDVLRNDRGFVCDNDNVSIDPDSLAGFSRLGGSLEIVEFPPDAAEPKEHVLYTAPCLVNATDQFTYEIVSTNVDAPDGLNSNATVRIVIVDPRIHPEASVYEAGGVDSFGIYGDPLNTNATFPPVPAGARVLALGWTSAEFDPTSGTQPDASFGVKLEDGFGVTQLVEANPYDGISAIPGQKICGANVLNDEPGEFWYTPSDGIVEIQFYEQSDDTLGSDGSWKSGSVVYLLLEEILISDGACCVAGDLCTQVTSDSECEDLDGVFQGSGTVCTPQICVFEPPAVFGACCIEQNGIEICTQSTAASCALLSGTYLGDDEPCVPQSCDDDAPIAAACCVPLADQSVLCTIATEEDCLLAGGEFQGEEAIDCEEVVCEPIEVEGACCTNSGSCAFVPESLCETTGGTFIGAGVECADIECEVLTGSCCIGSSCLELIESECNESEGIFRGEGTTCDGFDCELLLEGACCLGTLCFDTTVLACQVNGGEFQGVGTGCSSNTCSGFAVGSCCISEGSCAVVSLIDCASLGGTFRGQGTNCSDATVCLTGACCFGEICLLGTDAACSAFAGEFRGYGIACEQANCEGCPPDINDDGQVDVNDLLVLLEQFGEAGGVADINGDGIVDVNDVLILIANWGGDGC